MDHVNQVVVPIKLSVENATGDAMVLWLPANLLIKPLDRSGQIPTFFDRCSSADPHNIQSDTAPVSPPTTTAKLLRPGQVFSWFEDLGCKFKYDHPATYRFHAEGFATLDSPFLRNGGTHGFFLTSPQATLIVR